MPASRPPRSCWLVVVALAACASGPWYRQLGFISEADVRRPEAVPRLVSGLGSGDMDVVHESSRALSRLGEPAARALAVEMRENQSAVVAWALGEMGAAAAVAVPALADALRSGPQHLRQAAARSLARLGPIAAPALPALVRALASDPEDDVRREVPPALAAIGRPLPEVMTVLEHAASHDRGHRVKHAARRAYQALRFAPQPPHAAPRPQPQLQVDPTPGPASGKRPAVPPPVVALFDIQDSASSLTAAKLDQLSEYLAARLAVGGFRVIPREQVRARLVREKTKSYRDCADQSCQIELGRALAAQKTIACRLLWLKGQCALTAMLYDLRSETAERAATVETGCSEGQLLEGLRRLAVRLSDH